MTVRLTHFLLLFITLVLLEISRWIPRAHDMSPFYIPASVIILFCCMIPLFLRAPSGFEASKGPCSKLILLAILFCLCWGIYQYAHTILTVRYRTASGDMLGNICHGIRRILAGKNLYSELVAVPWILPMTYFPLLYLSFLPAAVFNMDIRFMGMIYYSTIFLGLIALHLNNKTDIFTSLTILMIAIFFALSRSVTQFFHIAHTPFVWMLIFFFCYSLWLGRYRLSTLLFTLFLTTRETAIVLLPLYLIYLWRTLNRKQFLFHLGFISVVTLLIWLPFFDLHGVQRMIRYKAATSNYIWQQVNQSWIFNAFGFGSIAYKSGLSAWLKPLTILGLIMLTIYTAFSDHLTSSRFFSICAVALLWFFHFSGIGFQYLYFPIVFFMLFASLPAPDVRPHPFFEKRIAFTLFVLSVFVALVLIPSYQNPTRYDISKNRGSLKGEIYARELNQDQGFVWTGNGATSFVFSLRNMVLEKPLMIDCQLSMRGYSCRGSKKQALQILVNGRYLTTFQLDDTFRFYSFKIPVSFLNPDDNVFTWVADYAISPKVCGESGDDRPLSVAYSDLIISPAAVSEQSYRDFDKFMDEMARLN
jgi:hypothetical protein